MQTTVQMRRILSFIVICKLGMLRLQISIFGRSYPNREIFPFLGLDILPIREGVLLSLL